MSFSPPYPIPKSFAHVVQKANLSPVRDFVTHLYFVAHPLLEIEERVKIHGAININIYGGSSYGVR